MFASWLCYKSRKLPGRTFSASWPISFWQQQIPYVEISIHYMPIILIVSPLQTSHTLQWVLYLLATHPEAQERAAAEISKENDWQKASYLKGAVKEALRLFPVAPFMTRFLPEESDIGGYAIPAQVYFYKCMKKFQRDFKIKISLDSCPPFHLLQRSERSLLSQRKHLLTGEMESFSGFK